jgi:amino acid efflux transporter
VVPNSLVIIVYIAAMAAGARLLTGLPRLIAVIAALPCLAILPFVGVALIIPAGVATGALLFTFWHRNERPSEAFGGGEQE